MPLSLTTVFADLDDPRIETANKLHPLTDILVIATCAVIAGADTWEEIAEYGRTKETFFRRFLALPHGVPSHDTFERVFAKLDPDAFADRFGRWMAELCESTGLVHIAVDGKSARHSPKDTFTGCLHLVSAWATANRLTLGQAAVPEGSNEVAAIPELLRALDLKGAIVTIDAAGTQVENAALIREGGGHYLLAAKGNQPALHEAVGAAFDRAIEAFECLVHQEGWLEPGYSLAVAYIDKGIAVRELGDLRGAVALVDRAIELGHDVVGKLRSLGEKSYLGWGLVNLASYLIIRGSISEARRIAGEGLETVREEGGFIVRVCIQQMALLAAESGLAV